MQRIIFARTRTNYDSYSDFWRLVELSGFETCYVDEIRLDSGATYIVTPVNGEVRPHIDNERRRCGAHTRENALGEPQYVDPSMSKRIVWALERPDAPGARPWKNEVSDLLRHFDEVWVSDRHMASLDPRVRFVPLGSDRGLARASSNRKTYDVAFMGYMIPRRQTIADKLRAKGFSIAPNGWGEERAEILAQTRLMLNVHQHNHPAPIGEPLRIALAAAFKLPLLSETLADPFPLEAGVDVIVAGYDDLVAAAAGLLGVDGERRMLAEKLQAKLCDEHPFRRGVEEAL